jgi:anaerobic magnesium-protoporphyrin IX monomethyl ester cyclase
MSLSGNTRFREGSGRGPSPKRILLVKGGHLTHGNSSITYPLGLMSIAGAVRRRFPEVEIRIRDLRLPGVTVRSVVSEAVDFHPDVVGLSAIATEAGSIRALSRALRDGGIRAPIVVGGPHATASFAEVLEDQCVDVVVIGEGETTFNQLLETFVDQGSLARVPGISYRADGTIVRGPARELIAELDELPSPAWDLVDIDLYSSFLSMTPIRTHRYMNLYTSRGCPYQCIFCHDVFGKKFRARSAETVVEEIETLKREYGIDDFEVVDDIFNCDLDRAKRILRLLRGRGVKANLSFPNGLRCDRLDREFLEELARLGTSHISVPVESASPRIQKLMRKNLDLDRVSETIDTCDELGIFTRGFFMLGFPSETLEELELTVDYACRSRLHHVLFFTAVPYPGTRLQEMCEDGIEKGSRDLERVDYFTSTINVSAVPDEVLLGMHRKAILRFYASPRRLLRLMHFFRDRTLLAKLALSCFYRFLLVGHKVSKSSLSEGYRVKYARSGGRTGRDACQ